MSVCVCENRVPTGADDTAILLVWNGPETYLLPDKDPPRGTKATGAKLCTTTVADTRISREIFILTEQKKTTIALSWTREGLHPSKNRWYQGRVLLLWFESLLGQSGNDDAGCVGRKKERPDRPKISPDTPRNEKKNPKYGPRHFNLRETPSTLPGYEEHAREWCDDRQCGQPSPLFRGKTLPL